MSERRCISLLVSTVFLPCVSWAYRTVRAGLRHEMSICLNYRMVYRPFDKSECSSLYFDIFHLQCINPLNPELNPICYLLALLGAHHFLHVSRIRVKSLTLRRLMSYIYMEHPFLMFLDHTQRRSTISRTPLDE